MLDSEYLGSYMKYFVSYFYKKGNDTGYGRCEVIKVKSLYDIENIESELIKKHSFDEVSILYFSKF